MKKYENFFDCLIIKKILKNNNNFLLNESYLTLNKEIISFFDFYSFFMFNKHGNLIMFYDNNNNIQNQHQSQKFYNYINILTKIVNNISKNINKKIKQEIFKFYINENKIIIYYISKIFLIGKFSNKTCNYFAQLLLLHIYISIINYKYDSIEKINLIKDKDYIDKYIFSDENEINNNKNVFYNSFSNTNVNENNLNNSNNDSKNEKSSLIFQDYLELKIYSKIFLKYIILHFISSFKSISQKKQLLLYNIKLKNIYYLNIKSKKIMFDYRKLNQNGVCKNFKYYKNNLIFNTIYEEAFKIYKKFSDNFLYKNLNENKYYKNINNFFSKIEFTSTYPRLSFFIKFFPCLDGIFIIHVYTQKKLSRNNNNSNNNNNYYYKHINNKYREFIKIFSNGKEFKYIEPEKLTNIQNFFNSFFMLNIENKDYYYENNNDNYCCYFNKDIINIINNLDRDIVLNKNINFILDKIFENLRNYYYYLQKIKDKKENDSSQKNDFNINKYFILYDMFKKNIIFNKTFPKYKNEINKNDNKDLNDIKKNNNHTAHNCIVNFDSKISMKNVNGFDINNYSFDKTNSNTNINIDNNNINNNNNIFSNNIFINKNANSNTYSSNGNTSIVNLKLSPNLQYRKSTLNFDITMLKDVYNNTDNDYYISPELKKRVSGISCIKYENDTKIQGSMKEFFNERKISFFDDLKFNDSSKNSNININKSISKNNNNNNKNNVNNNNSLNINDTDESLININNESGNNLLVNKKNNTLILNKKNIFSKKK